MDDQNDFFLLTIALAGEADYLVTGDHRAGLLQRGIACGARVIIPNKFCTEVL